MHWTKNVNIQIFKENNAYFTHETTNQTQLQKFVSPILQYVYYH